MSEKELEAYSEHLLTCVGVVAGAAWVGVLAGTAFVSGSCVTGLPGVCGVDAGVGPFCSGVTGVTVVFCTAGADTDLGTRNMI